MIPAVFLYSPTGKIFCQIIRMNILMLDQTLENMAFLFGSVESGLMNAALAQLGGGAVVGTPVAGTTL